MNNSLIIVDVQNDFCPGGAVPVPKGDQVIEPINKLLDFARKHNWLIVFSKDWHSPEEGCCAKNTYGSEFHNSLNYQDGEIIIYKGDEPSDKHFSVFFGDNIKLSKLLRDRNISDVYITGLALDYCVRATALDSAKYGFQTYLVKDASLGIFDKTTEENLFKELLDNNVKVIESSSLIKSQTN